MSLNEPDGASATSTESQQEGGFLQMNLSDEQLVAVAGKIAEIFLFNFVSTVFAERDMIIKNGQVDYEAMVQVHARAYRMSAGAADLMSKSLAATQTIGWRR
ncbi:hypothetical protein [Luteimonas deserti]|uniref:Uncharacterized protein n=1 Tax=Luteimonas deserti TaxID=2752306 RepID=A0A7Z0U0C6_9GAMM|nr:hypothetical protein [Luteimonas deserti]NYZ64312.1 hypothetical protein [Luteimonas deserti]